MKKIKQKFTFGINLSDYPKNLSIGAMVDDKQIMHPRELSEDQLATVIRALDTVRFDFQNEFYRRMSSLPSQGWFNGGEA